MKRIKPTYDFNANDIALTNFSMGETITYAQLAIGISNIHKILYYNNVGKGDHILLVNDGTPEWVTRLAGIVTYGAVAVIIPNNLSSYERADIITREGIREDIDLSDKSGKNTTHEAIDIDIFKFTLNDDIIIDYTYNEFGFLSPTRTKVYEFMQLAEDIKRRYMKIRHSRMPSMLLANRECMNAKEILASLSIGSHITLAGTHPTSGALLRCLKKCRPHFVYLDTKTAENMIRERVFPIMKDPDMKHYMNSSHARRTMLKQVRKRMMFALGGCILIVSVTGGRFSPEVEQFLQKIEFPYIFM